MSNDVAHLKALRNRLLEEGRALVSRGQSLLEASENLVPVIRALEPGYLPNEDGVAVHNEFARQGVPAKKERITGWQEFIDAHVLAHGASLENLFRAARENPEWQGVDDPTLRMRIRAALHQAKRRGSIQQADGLWKRA